MDNSTPKLTPAVLKWLCGAVIGVTVLPVLAVVVVLPFAGRVALAFQGGDSAVALTSQLALNPTGAAADALLSTSTMTPQSPTETAKVTGGGTVSVDVPRYASFGFVAQGAVGVPGGAKGNLNYVNHSTGVHINGPVDTIEEFTLNSPPGGGATTGTATFSGVDRHNGCSFTVKVTDNGEPGTTDRFGITGCGATFSGSVGLDGEQQLSGGNIQIHPTQAH